MVPDHFERFCPGLFSPLASRKYEILRFINGKRAKQLYLKVASLRDRFSLLASSLNNNGAKLIRREYFSESPALH